MLRANGIFPTNSIYIDEFKRVNKEIVASSSYYSCLERKEVCSRREKSCVDSRTNPRLSWEYNISHYVLLATTTDTPVTFFFYIYLLILTINKWRIYTYSSREMFKKSSACIHPNKILPDSELSGMGKDDDDDRAWSLWVLHWSC